jgi:hypothetical protein
MSATETKTPNLSRTALKPRPRARPDKFEAKAKAAKFCPRGVLEDEDTPRGPHPCHSHIFDQEKINVELAKLFDVSRHCPTSTD